GGRIHSSRFIKREGRPSEHATLTARIIDRSIRPLFPKGMKNEVQVIITVLSMDSDCQPDILGVVATSAALAISPIPWNGPVGAVRMGLTHDGDKIVNPNAAERPVSLLDLTLSGTKQAVSMVEP